MFIVLEPSFNHGIATCSLLARKFYVHYSR